MDKEALTCSLGIYLGQKGYGKVCSSCGKMRKLRLECRKSTASEDKEKLINLDFPEAIRHRNKMQKEELKLLPKP